MKFHDKKAIYLQIADFFLERILKGQIAPDERIASVRETAAELEVNPNTVMRTYSFMQENDLVYNKRGIGYFISDKAPEIAGKIKKDEFLKDELPLLFKTMDLLDIKLSDLETIYADSKSGK